MTARRTFTVGEANALVPRLELLVQRVQTLGLALQREVELATAGRDGAPLSPAELGRVRPGARLLMEELDAAMEEIQELGVEVKDLQLGLVDFPAERNGERVYLCWQTGEPEVAYWHGPADGFAGRQPLPGTARPPSLQ